MSRQTATKQITTGQTTPAQTLPGQTATIQMALEQTLSVTVDARFSCAPQEENKPSVCSGSYDE